MNTNGLDRPVVRGGYTQGRRSGFFVVLVVIATIIFIFPVYGETFSMPVSYQQNVRAPQFPRGLDWLNTNHPLTLSQLRGKVVLLDFWTYCCINCMHVLPILHKLEEKYGDSLVVIGVHSAKFLNEGETKNIREAILRYGIQHPVINDRDFKIWRSYAIHAWPTMVLIDPQGYVVDTEAGEGAPEIFDPMIEELIRSFASKGKLDTSPVALKPEQGTTSLPLLKFPGKILVDEAGNRLFISDSGHNRILVVDRTSASVLDVIGSGQQGIKDGSFAEARFNDPQGTELVGSMLYVADTKNHSVRAVDLVHKTITRIAGTGQQGGYGHGQGPALQTRLSSPWDLVWAKGRLYVAMAGTHQIWYYDPARKEVGLWAGSGREDIIDGPRLLAAFAQPSGITTDGKKRLFTADSEVSAIRSIELSPNGGVTSIVGEGLFDFGDVDGGRTRARLQHPLGISWYNSVLFVADTYNNKIKRIIPEEYRSVTYAGSGEEGHHDGELDKATFDEPGGLDVAENGEIYVADTNNHLVRIIHPKTNTVSTLVLKGLTPVLPQVPESSETSGVKRLSPISLHAGKAGILLSISFPEGYKLNAEGGVRVSVLDTEGQVQTIGKNFSANDLPLRVPLRINGSGHMTFILDYFFCRKDNEGLCFLGEETYRLPIRDGDDLPISATVEIEAHLPNP